MGDRANLDGAVGAHHTQGYLARSVEGLRHKEHKGARRASRVDKEEREEPDVFDEIGDEERGGAFAAHPHLLRTVPTAQACAGCHHKEHTRCWSGRLDDEFEEVVV
eukprot:1071107-Prymnesium_polylepis.6